jgi:hypothetical protein
MELEFSSMMILVTHVSHWDLVAADDGAIVVYVWFVLLQIAM